MGKMLNISDEERERRRQNALALKAEGRIGPQFGKLGGRPRKPRASTIIAERVADDANLFYDRLKEIVESGMDANSIKAITTALKAEEQERLILEREQVNLEQAKRDELIEIVANGLKELLESGVSIDGWGSEALDAEFEELSESDASPQTTTEG